MHAIKGTAQKCYWANCVVDHSAPYKQMFKSYHVKRKVLTSWKNSQGPGRARDVLSALGLDRTSNVCTLLQSLPCPRAGFVGPAAPGSRCHVCFSSVQASNHPMYHDELRKQLINWEKPEASGSKGFARSLDENMDGIYLSLYFSAFSKKVLAPVAVGLVKRSLVPLMYRMKAEISDRLSPKDQSFHPDNPKVRRHALIISVSVY